VLDLGSLIVWVVSASEPLSPSYEELVALVVGNEGTVPVERTAMLMASLLGTPVSTGFVARALERFAHRLVAAGFDDAMTTALRAEDVPVVGSPHAVTVRTPDARLVWYAPIGSRSKNTLAGLRVLEGYAGYLVRDDYAGWHQFDAQLASVQPHALHRCGRVKVWQSLGLKPSLL
jgi:transposase